MTSYRRRVRNFFKKKILLMPIMIIALILLVTACTSSTDAVDDTKSLPEQKKEQEQQPVLETATKEQQAKEEAKPYAEGTDKEKAANEAKAAQELLIATLGLEEVTVARVVDGDTIETSTGQKVRLIGVNTPESTNKQETFGKEASAFTKSQLSGKVVYLQKDVSETDRYGRLLRVVWQAVPKNDLDENEIRSKMFNAKLVLGGYAEPSTYPPDVKYSELFVRLAREAREAGVGLWKYGTDGTTRGDLDGTTNVGSKQAKSARNDSTNKSEVFANCTELRTKYPDGVPSTHPAYQSKMDRDRDDFACER